MFNAISLTCECNEKKLDQLNTLALDITHKLINISAIADVLECIEHLSTLILNIERVDLAAAMHNLVTIQNCGQLVIQFDSQKLVWDYAKQSLRTTDLPSLKWFEYTGNLLTFVSHHDNDLELLIELLIKQQDNFHMIHLITETIEHLRAIIWLPAARAIYKVNGIVVGTFFRLGYYIATNIEDAELDDCIPYDAMSVKIFSSAGKSAADQLLDLEFLTNLSVVHEKLDGYLVIGDDDAADADAAYISLDAAPENAGTVQYGSPVVAAHSNIAPGMASDAVSHPAFLAPGLYHSPHDAPRSDIGSTLHAASQTDASASHGSASHYTDSFKNHNSYASDYTDSPYADDSDTLQVGLLKKLKASSWPRLRFIQIYLDGADDSDKLKRLDKLFQLKSLEKVTIVLLNFETSMVLEIVEYCNGFNGGWEFESNVNQIIGKKVKFV